MEYEINLIVTVMVGLCTIAAMLAVPGRTSGLRSHATLVGLFGLMLCFVCLGKIFYLDNFVRPGDQDVMDGRARWIAASMQLNGLRGLDEYIGSGNRFYQFALGCFYGLTDAPQEVLYIINGSFALLGLLSLIETITICSGQRRPPTWLLLLIFVSPTVLFFSTLNLKEGPNLWAVCMTLRFARYNYRNLTAQDYSWGIIGLCLLCLFRAHFAAAWIIALGITVLITRKKIALAACLLLVSSASIPALQYAKPEKFDALMNEGLMEAAEQHYEMNNDRGGSAINHAAGGPLPFVTGFTLLMFRPYPWEVFDISSLMAAMEVWVLTGIIFCAWVTSSHKSRLIQDPLVLTGLMVLLLMSFLFSYQYNMGLMVRHRLQVFPAFYLLLVTPVLARQKRFSPAHKLSLNHSLRKEMHTHPPIKPRMISY